MGDDKNVLKLDGGMVARLCEYAENHRAAPFKWANCVVCGLCLNKAIIIFFSKKIYIYVYEKIGKTLWGLFPPPGAHLTPPGRVVRPRAYGEGPQEVPDPSALLLPLTHPERSGQGPAELSRYRGSCRFAHSRNGSSGSYACDRQVTVDAGASG